MTARAITEPIALAGHTAPSRVLFGPHETNLARGRAIGDRHVAYYARRAAGGAGVIVTETASVHRSDWPYERAPLASDCQAGWAAVKRACRPHGTLVLAGLGHTGAQGSSAFGQEALWAPSRVADAASRELPLEMEQAEIDAVVDGFAAAAAAAAAVGCDGVEIDAGPGALLRQFHSGLTNLRTDAYGTDKLLLTRRVLERVRTAVGPDHVVALRLSCDELAPWAGVTPEAAAAQAVALSGLLDLLVVTRGGPFSASAYRPDGHTPPMVNTDLARTIRAALTTAGATTRVVLQGSVVDPGPAGDVIVGGAADLVEMTRALIADAALPLKVRHEEADRVRPCVLCNQTCRVRDNRNPLVTCIADPRSGHETLDPDVDAPRADRSDGPAGPRRVRVVGAGPAGLETARVLAARGHRVTVTDAAPVVGGAVGTAARLPGRARFALLVDWWHAECTRAGVTFELGSPATAPGDGPGVGAEDGSTLVLATGGRPAPPPYPVAEKAVVLTAQECLADGVPENVDGPVVVADAVGGPIALGIAELLAAAGRQVEFVTADQIAGTMLALSGDLADGNTRLARAGVTRRTSMILREARAGSVVLEDRFSGDRTEIDCGALVHCGHLLPVEELYLGAPGTVRAGDCVAPRTVLEAVLEARRAADAVESLPAVRGAQPSVTRPATESLAGVS